MQNSRHESAPSPDHIIAWTRAAWVATVALANLIFFTSFYNTVKRESLNKADFPPPGTDARGLYILKRFFIGQSVGLVGGITAAMFMPFRMEQQDDTMCEVRLDVDNVCRSIVAVGVVPVVGAFVNYIRYENQDRANQRLRWRTLHQTPNTETHANRKTAHEPDIESQVKPKTAIEKELDKLMALDPTMNGLNLNAFMCPVNFTPMTDPVMLIGSKAKTTCDRSAATRWLRDHNTDPADGSVLANKEMCPNNFVKRLILTEIQRAYTETKQNKNNTRLIMQ
ncbi:MAG TPA: U-box domain-containing protein [Gammaproteobacteria bacterium]|nr:U-box domain-containing protein [Gammaproteobacteria bacterium]